jgi:hypothetical protein
MEMIQPLVQEKWHFVGFPRWLASWWSYLKSDWAEIGYTYMVPRNMLSVLGQIVMKHANQLCSFELLACVTFKSLPSVLSLWKSKRILDLGWFLKGTFR